MRTVRSVFDVSPGNALWAARCRPCVRMLWAPAVVAVVEVAAGCCSAMLRLPTAPVTGVATNAQRCPHKPMCMAVIPYGCSCGHACRAHELRCSGPVSAVSRVYAVEPSGEFAAVHHGIQVAASGAVSNSSKGALASIGHHYLADSLEPAVSVRSVVCSEARALALRPRCFQAASVALRKRRHFAPEHDVSEPVNCRCDQSNDAVARQGPVGILVLRGTDSYRLVQPAAVVLAVGELRGDFPL